MRRSLLCISLLSVVLSASTVLGGPFISGSDGCDGPFNPLFDVEVDLSLAADVPMWDTPSPVEGQGVYDAQQWAVVFKYTSINIPAGVTVTFKNHPKGAPVVWLATENVTIDGTVSLDGGEGSPGGTPSPSFSIPGPGGFAGAQVGFDFSDPFLFSSAALGPAGADRCSNAAGGGGGYQTDGENCGAGRMYGNEFVSPLIGGSGGGAHPTNSGGGAGGGCILIASSGQIAVNGEISAQGGTGASPSAGGGSGGCIRLIADTLIGAGTIDATGQFGPGGSGGTGWTRVEAICNNLMVQGNPPWTESTPGPVFPPSTAPTLRVVTVNDQSGPNGLDDPLAGILTTDVTIDNEQTVPVFIEATNIPANTGTTVTVRIVPYRGNDFTVTSTELFGDFDNSSVTVMVPNFPRGRSEIQVKAVWDPMARRP